MEERGQWRSLPDGMRLMATVHPSYLLRLPDERTRQAAYQAFTEDLARFALAFAQGQVVKSATRDQMVQRPTLKDGAPAPNPMGSPDYFYGLGVMVGPVVWRDA